MTETTPLDGLCEQLAACQRSPKSVAPATDSEVQRLLGRISVGGEPLRTSQTQTFVLSKMRTCIFLEPFSCDVKCWRCHEKTSTPVEYKGCSSTTSEFFCSREECAQEIPCTGGCGDIDHAEEFYWIKELDRRTGVFSSKPYCYDCPTKCELCDKILGLEGDELIEGHVC